MRLSVYHSDLNKLIDVSSTILLTDLRKVSNLLFNLYLQMKFACVELKRVHILIKYLNAECGQWVICLIWIYSWQTRMSVRIARRYCYDKIKNRVWRIICRIAINIQIERKFNFLWDYDYESAFFSLGNFYS